MGVFGCFGGGATKEHHLQLTRPLPRIKDGTRRRGQPHPQSMTIRDFEEGPLGDSKSLSATTLQARPGGSSISSCGSTAIPDSCMAFKNVGVVAWAHVDELEEEVANLRQRLLAEEEVARHLREEVQLLQSKTRTPTKDYLQLIEADKGIPDVGGKTLEIGYLDNEETLPLTPTRAASALHSQNSTPSLDFIPRSTSPTKRKKVRTHKLHQLDENRDYSDSYNTWQDKNVSREMIPNPLQPQNGQQQCQPPGASSMPAIASSGKIARAFAKRALKMPRAPPIKNMPITWDSFSDDVEAVCEDLQKEEEGEDVLCQDNSLALITLPSCGRGTNPFLTASIEGQLHQLAAMEAVNTGTNPFDDPWDLLLLPPPDVHSAVDESTTTDAVPAEAELPALHEPYPPLLALTYESQRASEEPSLPSVSPHGSLTQSQAVKEDTGAGSVTDDEDGDTLKFSRKETSASCQARDSEKSVESFSFNINPLFCQQSVDSGSAIVSSTRSSSSLSFQGLVVASADVVSAVDEKTGFVMSTGIRSMSHSEEWGSQEYSSCKGSGTSQEPSDSTAPLHRHQGQETTDISSNPLYGESSSSGCFHRDAQSFQTSASYGSTGGSRDDSGLCTSECGASTFSRDSFGSTLEVAGGSPARNHVVGLAAVGGSLEPLQCSPFLAPDGDLFEEIWDKGYAEEPSVLASGKFFTRSINQMLAPTEHIGLTSPMKSCPDFEAIHGWVEKLHPPPSGFGWT